MIELVKNTKIDFMGLKKYAFSFSAILVIVGIVGTVQIYRGKANLGIDLAGGTSIQLKFQKPFSMDEIRSLLAKAGHGEATLQEVSGENILLVKLRALGKEDEKMVAEPMVNLLRQSLPGNPFVVESVSEIGPAIGHKLRQDAELAMLVSALAIIIYLAWRFEFKFGVAAAIATSGSRRTSSSSRRCSPSGGTLSRTRSSSSTGSGRTSGSGRRKPSPRRST
jgi:preprotein translocase subunit SecF